MMSWAESNQTGPWGPVWLWDCCSVEGDVGSGASWPRDPLEGSSPLQRAGPPLLRHFQLGREDRPSCLPQSLIFRDVALPRRDRRKHRVQTRVSASPHSLFSV